MTSVNRIPLGFDQHEIAEALLDVQPSLIPELSIKIAEFVGPRAQYKLMHSKPRYGWLDRSFGTFDTLHKATLALLSCWLSCGELSHHEVKLYNHWNVQKQQWRFGWEHLPWNGIRDGIETFATRSLTSAGSVNDSCFYIQEEPLNIVLDRSSHRLPKYYISSNTLCKYVYNVTTRSRELDETFEFKCIPLTLWFEQIRQKLQLPSPVSVSRSPSL